jgi:serine/threonine-protein kinase
VPGRSLKQEIAEHGQLDLETTAHLLEQMAAALGHLHKRGLVHLDVKPQNLIVTPEKTVKLIDFGIAQRAGQSQEMIGGLAFGTAAYLAPEQACGDPVDAATDVYSLGCVVYELVTGAPPFAGNDGSEVKDDVIRAHLELAPAPPSKARPDLKLPRWVDEVILWALAKQPNDRYGDTATFARLFREGVEGEIAETIAATTRIAPAPIIDTRQVAPTLTPEAARPVRGSQVAAAAYRAGGQKLRSASGLRRMLWRFVIAFGVVNILLALILINNDGSLPGLSAGEPTLKKGAEAQVIAESFRFRAGPGLSYETLTMVHAGDQLEITGNSVDADGRTWWPVEATVDGYRLEGFIAEEGIEPTSSGGNDWLSGLLN